MGLEHPSLRRDEGRHGASVRAEHSYPFTNEEPNTGCVNRRVLGTHVHRGAGYEKGLRPNTGCILGSVELKVRKRHKLRIPIIALTVL
jgi:hypothetical protein